MQTRLRGAGIVAVFTFIFLWSVRPLFSYDIWFHLETGRQVFAGHMPWSESYLGTSRGFAFSAYGNSAWLTSAFFYFAYLVGGVAGLAMICPLLITLTGAVVYKICLRLGMSNAASLMAVLFGVWTVRRRFDVRTVLLTDLALALLIFILLKYEGRPKHRLIALGLLFACWTNLHAGVLVGWILVFVWLIAGERPFLWKRVLAALSVVFCASHLRPYGHQLIPYWYDHFNNKYAFLAVSEWKPHDLPTIVQNQGLFAVLSVAAIAHTLFRFRGRLKEVPWHYVLLLAMFCYLSLKTARGVNELLPVGIPMLAALRPRVTPPRWVYSLVACSLVVMYVGAVDLRYYTRLTDLYPRYPVRILGDLDPNGGQVYNAYEYGGFLVFEGYRPFIHGRTDLYREGLFPVNDAIMNDDENREKLLEEYEITQILLNTPAKKELPPGLMSYLDNSNEWALVSFDDSGFVFRKNPPPETIIEAIVPWASPPWSDERLAEQELVSLVERRPSVVGFVLLSQIRRNRQEWAGSVQAARKALEIEPENLGAWQELVFSSAQLRDAETLVTASRRMLEEQPDAALMHYYLALGLYLKMDEPADAGPIGEHLERAAELDPNLAQAIELKQLLEQHLKDL